jgi:hypothetical protein
MRATGERHSREQTRRSDVVEPGFYRLRLRRGAWAVPARIVRTDDGEFFAIIDGCEHSPHADPFLAEGVSDVHAYGTKIDEQTYDWLLAVKAHAAAHGPDDHPALNPTRAINPARLSPLQPRTP